MINNNNMDYMLLTSRNEWFKDNVISITLSEQQLNTVKPELREFVKKVFLKYGHIEETFIHDTTYNIISIILPLSPKQRLLCSYYSTEINSLAETKNCCDCYYNGMIGCIRICEIVLSGTPDSFNVAYDKMLFTFLKVHELMQTNLEPS